MRQLNATCLLCRHKGLFNSTLSSASRLARTPIRASSLSAIHRGLRDSEKARPQGFKPGSLETTPSRQTKPSTSRSRRDPDWVPPNFKLKKGKKDITDKGPQPMSRRARFNNPDESFGKRSLVSQFKSGKLGEQLARLSPEKSRSSRDGVISKDDFERSFHASNGASNGRKEHSKRPERDSRSSKQQPRSGDKRFEDKFEARVSRDKPEWSREKSQGKDGFGLATKKNTSWEMRGGPSQENRGGSDKNVPWEMRGRQHTSRDNRGEFTNNKPRETRGSPSQENRGEFTKNKPWETRESPSQENRGEITKNKPWETRESPSQENRGEITKNKPWETRGGTSQENRGEFTKNKPWETRGGTSQENRGEFTRDKPQGQRESTFQNNRDGFAKTTTAHSRNEHDIFAAIAEDSDDGPIRIHHTTAASQFLYGRSVVEATLKNSGRRLYRMYIYNGEDRQNLSQDVNLETLARQKGVDIRKLGRNGLRMMDKMSGGRPHNGCILEASPLPQLPLKALGPLSEDPAKPGYSVELAHQSSEEAQINGTSNFFSYQLPRERKPFILLLDGILDPGNLGAIIRSTAFLGVNAVAISKHSSATLTPVALKASAGASEVMTLFSVNSTIDFITRSKESGWMVYAAVPSTSRSRGNSHLTIDRVETYDPLATRPTILVVGSEGEGLPKQIRREADFEVSIPSASGLISVVDSLNVSVATGILCSAFLKKQQSAGVEIEESVPTGEEEALW